MWGALRAKEFPKLVLRRSSLRHGMNGLLRSAAIGPSRSPRYSPSSSISVRWYAQPPGGGGVSKEYSVDPTETTKVGTLEPPIETDEAAVNGAQPDKLELLKRQIETLEIELEDLKDESDVLSVERRIEIEDDLKEKREEAKSCFKARFEEAMDSWSWIAERLSRPK